ncbi:MAG: radical SAM protein [Vulcanimicrobiaceae bacterium]
MSRKVATYLRSRETLPVSKPLYGEWEANDLESAPNWTPSQSTLETLARRGYLTQKSHADEVAFFKSFVDDLHEMHRRSRPHYVMMPTYDCNLRCHYCFQDHMRTNPAFHGLLSTMSESMADRIMASFPFIEREFHTCAPSELPPREFTFFGGEPLLAASRPIIEHIIRAQQGISKANFGAVTNGTELHAYADLLGPSALSWLQITIDGPRELHDRRRVYADKGSSFEIIARNVDLALERGVRLSVRVNVDRANVQSLALLATSFIEKGWANTSNFNAYLAPINDYSGLKNAGRRPDFFNYWELGEVLRAIHTEQPHTRVFSRVDGGLRERASGVFATAGVTNPKPAFCGAHVAMYLFDAFGDIYACWDRTGDQNLKIGNVNEDGTATINDLGNLWRSRTVASNATCRQCRYALHCGGGCAVLAEVSSGTMFSNFCNAFGTRYRTAVAEAYTDYTQGTVAESVKVPDAPGEIAGNVARHRGASKLRRASCASLFSAPRDSSANISTTR